MNSLLQSLMTEHLDPGYAAAAHDKVSGHSRRSRVPAWMWLTWGLLVVGVVLGIALNQTRDRSDATAVRNGLVARVHEAEQRNADLSAKRDALAATANATRDRALAGNAQGSGLVQQIDRMDAAAAAQAVHGPGIVVELSDRSSDSDRSIILDRDLQSVVNALWASGAEAVAIDDVRMGPADTVRQAGGAMLVDNQPVSSPYRVAAIGDPAKLQTGFVVNDAYIRMAGLHQLYDVGFTVDRADELELPAATLHDLHVAREGGS